MRSVILRLLAVGLLAGPMAARAVMVTELLQVTLPSASGPYSAGHVFDITVAYDDGGTDLRGWNDGANGIAEFGGGDDTLGNTENVASYPGYTLFSDAQISISGLAALPVGSTASDVASSNRAWYVEFGDPSTDGFYYIQLMADDLYFYVLQYGSATNFRSSLLTWQTYRSATGNDSSYYADVSGNNLVSRTAVPEPGTLALLGFGIAGLGLTKRRKEH